MINGICTEDSCKVLGTGLKIINFSIDLNIGNFYVPVSFKTTRAVQTSWDFGQNFTPVNLNANNRVFKKRLEKIHFSRSQSSALIERAENTLQKKIREKKSIIHTAPASC